MAFSCPTDPASPGMPARPAGACHDAETFRLGTAAWTEGAMERRALVAPLPSDPVPAGGSPSRGAGPPGEARRGPGGGAGRGPGATQPAGRSWKAGPGPSSGSGRPSPMPRSGSAAGISRISWRRRRPRSGCCPACPRPAVLRRGDGTHLDRLAVQGPGGTLGTLPQPTLAVVGLHPGRGSHGLVPGPGGRRSAPCWADGWSWTSPRKATLELRCGSHHRRIPLDTWTGLEMPELAGGGGRAPAGPEAPAHPRARPRERRSPCVAAFETLLPAGLGPTSPHLTRAVDHPRASMRWTGARALSRVSSSRVISGWRSRRAR